MQYILLKDKSYSVENLPSEPRLLVELLNLCYQDGANFEQLTNAITQDSGLTAKILQVANSPAYRQWNQITDVRRMLIILGLSNVRNIVTTCAIQQFFASFSLEFSQNIQFIWLRALHCANLAERLAKLTRYNNPGEAFLAGLLHQVGMLLFLINREKEYLPVLDRYYADPSNFLAQEKNLMQATHCELGAALVNSWKLDSFIADAIEFQHAPTKELLAAPVLLKIIAVASSLSAYNNACKNCEVISRAGALFNLTEGTILDCVQRAVTKSQKMIVDLGYSGKFYLEEQEAACCQMEQISQNNKQLGLQVQDIALATTIAKEESSEYLELAKSLRVGIKTLFNLDQIVFFRVEDNRTRLIPINDLRNNQLSAIVYDLPDTQSALLAALKTGRGGFQTLDNTTITDRQVLRILGSQEAFCLPIGTAEAPLGLVVLGLRHDEASRLNVRLPLLQLLGQTIAQSYRKCEQKIFQEPGISMLEFRKITHEVSNPLTIVRNYLYILSKKLETSVDAQQDLQLISDEIERAGNILLRAKEDTSAITSQTQVNINNLLTSINQLFLGSIYQARKISSELLLDNHIPTILSEADNLKQILINIIKNAVEALPEGGTIVITTRDNYYQDNRKYIEVSIRDNGPGIPERILTNLFQPVESTKTGHSGLGLTIVKTLVDELHGHISCYSAPQAGTEFKLLIPRNLKSCKGESK